MIKASFSNAATALKDYKTYILGISMNTETHAGEGLERIVDLINSRPHEKTRINVGDTLKRYSYMADGLSEEQATTEALLKGDKWIEDNKHILERLKSKYKIVRWSELIEDPRFSGYYDAFERAWENSEVLRSAIEQDIDNFYSRSDKLVKPTSLEREYSTRFFLEELAAYSIQFEDIPSAQLYAGKELRCTKEVRLGNVENVPTGLQNCKFFMIWMSYPSNDDLPDAPSLEENLQAHYN